MKTILITGANRGSGLEHARRFAAQGHRVLAAVRTPHQEDELRALSKEYSDLISIHAYDASLPDAAVQLRAAVGATPIDIRFANAGALGGNAQAFGAVAGTELPW